MKNPVIIFIMFIIVIIVAIGFWDNWIAYKYANSNLTANKTAPQLFPHIPFQFTNLIILVIGLIVIFLFIVSMVRYFVKE
jgi:UDP-N-acetylmuramyl pentapeptide phosphotransferase/UDP-N-acetylglucosamine-1-phosphate transferase